MITRFLWATTLLAFVARGMGAPALAASPDAALARGIQQVETGEWAPAIKTLGEVARRLSGDRQRAAEAAQAYLYSGLAYVGLGETSPAISQFALALKLDPKVRIPAARENPAARDAFEVARVEAVSPVEPKAGKRSPLPFILGGAALVGGGVALAAGGGGAADKGPSNPVPASFMVTGTTGTPPLLLLSAVPGSSSTIQLRQTGPLMTFALRYDPILPARVRATVELIGLGPTCITGRTSEITTVDPAVAAATLVVNTWQITCGGATFTTTAMIVRLIDADAEIPVSLTSYSGGYVFVP